MLKTKLIVVALSAAFALPAFAEEAPAAAPALTSNVTLINDYLYRGISQTGANPAIQGGFDYAHASGLYVGAWGSSISWLSDAGVASNSGLELDTYGGYKFATGDVSYDVGYLRYNYPGTYPTTAVKADTDEVYGAITYSIVTAKASYSLGNLFGVAESKGSTYLELNAAYPLADSGYTLGAHYGKQTVASSGTPDNSALTYSDYKLSVSKDLGSGFSGALAYSSTNATSSYTILTNDLGKGRVLVSIGRAL
jgi:uncharacterized protein (TIGR02001 family)